MFFFLILSVLSFCAGFLSSYMGIGGGIIIVSLLPVFTDFSPEEIIKISLCLVFCLTLFNSLIFLSKNLIAWDWTLSLIVTGSGFAFLSGSFVPEFSDFSLRFLLWCFLLFVVSFPFIAKYLFQRKKYINNLSFSIPSWFKVLWSSKENIPIVFKKFEVLQKKKSRKPKQDQYKTKNLNSDQHKNRIQRNSLKIFGGALMGLCSGLTGMGGGMILSPLLHESGILSLKKIAPSLSFTTLFISVFALMGQLSNDIYLNASMKSVFFYLLLFALSGLALGHFFHGRDNKKKRILIVRTVTMLLFLKVSMELVFLYFDRI